MFRQMALGLPTFASSRAFSQNSAFSMLPALANEEIT
eukprot:CAMPEP_0115111666 /NCGR_PEP_ID=MMETSP0227-20121206/40180_1 /TAXON_ID=89957 /ORGANISM="Polarella glacialis, Strain CCMP 1383" /LENGTH=36 /DNA_ID= /DNA_START= /DNA_END= /DNA_ORIENTATION=